MTRAEELKQLIDKYDDLYYNGNLADPEAQEQLISDAEYDALKDEYLALVGEQGYDYVPGDAQVNRFEHKFPIRSLGKVNTEADLRKELERLAPGVIELKYDGMTVVIYPDSEGYMFVPDRPVVAPETTSLNFTGVTRGNGLVGEEISEAVRKIENFHPVAFNRIKAPIRCEAYMKLSAFKALNEERIKNGEEPFQNPRNAAAGMLRQKDVKKVKGITMTAYDIVGSTMKETDKLNMMYRAGVPVPDPKLTFKFDKNNIEDAVKWCLNFDREALDYEIDGLVIKSNIPNSLAVFGETGHHPKNAVAYKFPAQGKWTVLKGVTWQPGRTGKLTPVAELDPPVEILGSSISRCTLHNQNYIDGLDLKIGSEVYVIKANDVIPAITQSRLPGVMTKLTTIKEPKTCPVCGGKVEKVKDQSFCRNPLCKAKLLTGVTHIAKRDALDIEGLAEGTVQKMIDAGYLNIPVDIFKVTADQIKALEGFAAKSANKLYSDIQKSRKAPLDRFIYASGIPGVGRTASKDIANEFGTFADFMVDVKTGGKRLAKIDGIGKVTVKDIVTYQNLLGMMFMYVTPEDVVKPQSAPMAANGGVAHTFVLTGSMSRVRSDIESELRRLGHTVQDRVTKTTEYLVTGANVGSTKTEAARKKGVKVISEQEMWDMVRA